MLADTHPRTRRPTNGEVRRQSGFFFFFFCRLLGRAFPPHACSLEHASRGATVYYTQREAASLVPPFLLTLYLRHLDGRTTNSPNGRFKRSRGARAGPDLEARASSRFRLAAGRPRVVLLFWLFLFTLSCSPAGCCRLHAYFRPEAMWIFRRALINVLENTVKSVGCLTRKA